ncbi:MAG TPA: hypothetical protein VFB45_12990 [Pseudolabrys sp.]|nr:hypothetical protein [Pseudolabrys sp.]
MRHVVMIAATAAALVLAGMLATSPARADFNGGGPLTQNGQCWTPSSYIAGNGFGTWGPCAKPMKMRKKK